jgi:hypothetical protein
MDRLELAPHQRPAPLEKSTKPQKNCGFVVREEIANDAIDPKVDVPHRSHRHANHRESFAGLSKILYDCTSACRPFATSIDSE